MSPTPLQIENVPLDQLHPDPANARTHNQENLEAIEASLSRFGQAEPLIIHAKTNRIIGGNGRFSAMKNLGWTHADIVRLDIDNLEATALGIALNRTAELAGWDDQTLGKLLEELQTEEALEGVGFSDSDIEDLLNELNVDGDQEIEVLESVIPQAPEKATTQKGHLWLLGDHRLLCGDSSNNEDVDRLVKGESIDLVNTDPPYNVKVEPRSNNAIAAGLSSFSSSENESHSIDKNLRPKDRPLENDFVTDEEFDQLLRDWFGNISRVLKPGGAFYIWGGYANLANYPSALKESNLYFSQAIIWDKKHPVLTRKDFLGCFELAFYGWKEGKAHNFFGPTNARDLWEVKKVSPQKMVHLTEKPIELAARSIQYSSRKGERVLDLFGGSGSTLMACEQLKRKAHLIEIDPLYCDVIIQRWQESTGEKALLDGTDQSFDELNSESSTEEDEVDD